MNYGIRFEMVRSPRVPRIMPPAPDMSIYPKFPDNKLASFWGPGTLEVKKVARNFKDAGIVCCVCGVGALIFYGAGRVRSVSDSPSCIKIAINYL